MVIMTVIMVGLVGVTHCFYAGGTRLISARTGTTSLVYDSAEKRVSGGLVKTYSGPRRVWIHCVERWKAGSYRVPSLLLSSSKTVASESMVTPFHSNSATTTTTNATELAADSAYMGRNAAAPYYAPSKLLQSIIEAYHRRDISLFIGLLKDCAAKNHRLDILSSIAYPRMQALLDGNDGVDAHDACRLSDSIICDMLWIIGRNTYHVLVASIGRQDMSMNMTTIPSSSDLSSLCIYAFIGRVGLPDKATLVMSPYKDMCFQLINRFTSIESMAIRDWTKGISGMSKLGVKYLALPYEVRLKLQQAIVRVLRTKVDSQAVAMVVHW